MTVYLLGINNIFFKFFISNQNIQDILNKHMKIYYNCNGNSNIKIIKIISDTFEKNFLDILELFKKYKYYKNIYKYNSFDKLVECIKKIVDTINSLDSDIEDIVVTDNLNNSMFYNPIKELIEDIENKMNRYDTISSKNNMYNPCAPMFDKLVKDINYSHIHAVHENDEKFISLINKIKKISNPKWKENLYSLKEYINEQEMKDNIFEKNTNNYINNQIITKKIYKVKNILYDIEFIEYDPDIITEILYSNYFTEFSIIEKYEFDKDIIINNKIDTKIFKKNKYGRIGSDVIDKIIIQDIIKKYITDNIKEESLDSNYNRFVKYMNIFHPKYNINKKLYSSVLRKIPDLQLIRKSDKLYCIKKNNIYT